MIARLVGTVAELLEEGVLLMVGGTGYEVLVPAGMRPELAGRLNAGETVLHTMQYLEGNPGKGNLVPRILGFLSPVQKGFFELLTTVDGIGVRTALRAMAVPSADIAAAIEGRDAAFLARLPGIGKRTAEKVIATLHGKCADYAAGSAHTPTASTTVPASTVSAPGRSLSAEQQAAVAVLLSLGERPADAEALVLRTAKGLPAGTSAEELVRAIYAGGKATRP